MSSGWRRRAARRGADRRGLRQAGTVPRRARPSSATGRGCWAMQLTLADLHAAPIIDYFRHGRRGARLLARHGRLAAWWDRIAKRPSLAAG